ncbi:hypothetical protein [Roseibium suaedae]|uniref:Uncharacterized protein n=1 Tax=Roseibium suaedae TaxID=735517 RepID=A0A1M7N4H8_9HYPH|nr:hypothetical protein [Roseibium suaedae]SHM97921.1 hypothetical protein SAMN05444272_3680 [Roseibium suaedae]
MYDFDFSRAIGLMVRTAPYIAFRAVTYFAIAAAYVLVTGTGAGIGYGVGGFSGPDEQIGYAFWGGIIGFGLTAGVLYFLREYILYNVKAGHIAVMVEMIDGRPLPEGKGQITYGASVVKERFVEASVLFGIDQLIKGVIRAVTGLMEFVLDLIPVPGLDNIAKILRAFLNVAVGFVDEVILAHAIRTRSDNPWGAAHEALVLYGQNHRRMMKNAAFVALFVYGFAFLVFLVMLAPAATVAYLIPGGWSAGGVVFAVLFAWAVKAAVLEPLAIACMLQAFFKVTDGQALDPAWDERLESLSDKFTDIKEKAMAYVPTPRSPRTAPEAAAGGV